MNKDPNIWPKVITVDKNIVKTLSESTYENFPNALKELITNGYDAQATQVNLSVNLKKKEITVVDNGHGMNSADYEFYLRIAGKKREKQESNQKQRKTIGKFGVGFLSIFPFFKTYQIESTKRGSDQVMHATIPCHAYFSDSNSQIHVGDIKIAGGNRTDKTQIQEHYTRITLTGFTRITEEFFFPDTTLKYKTYSIKNPRHYDTLEKLEWVLSEDLPLRYEDDRYNELFFDYSKNLPFSVYINEKELLRKVYANDILDKHREEFDQIGKIKYQYIICTDRKPVHPVEARLIKIRNLNVGVGEREKFGNETVGGHSRLQQLTGELHILEGLNELIKVSRDGFSYSPDYERLKDEFARKLRKLSKQLEEEKDAEERQDTSKIKFVKKLNPVKKAKPTKQENIQQSTQVQKDVVTPPVEEAPIEARKETLSPIAPNLGFDKEEEVEQQPPDKIFEISGHKFVVKSDSWDYDGASHPACHIDGDTLIINADYPLFHGRKHTDVFIKLHVYLLIKKNDGLITPSVYEQMAKDILKIYEGY